MLEVCWLEVHSCLNKVEGPPKPQGHKENFPTFISKFINSCNKVHPKTYNKPFLSSEFCKVNSTFIFPNVIPEDASVVFKVGTEQYNNFTRSRFIYGEDFLDSKFSKNQLKLLKDSDTVQNENPKLVFQHNY